MTEVYMDDYGVVRCGACGQDLTCNGYGNMPGTCPVCCSVLDWAAFNPKPLEKTNEDSRNA